MSLSPYINRFLNADTIVPGYANPQNLNRYSYVTNNPLRYTDPTGHMQCEDYEGSCVSQNQVTKINKAKQEKNRQKSIKKNMRRGGNSGDTETLSIFIPTSTVIPGITLPVTISTQQCLGGPPCINNLVPSATPTVTSTPVNVLATAGAELDIAVNTAVVGAVKYCTSNDAEPPCGQSIDQAFPAPPPFGSGGLGTIFDAGVGTTHLVTENIPPGSQPSISNGVIYSSIAIPTSLIPLLIFAFGL